MLKFLIGVVSGFLIITTIKIIKMTREERQLKNERKKYQKGWK